MKPGQRNLITDVPGILVGNASDDRVKTGTTVLTSMSRLAAGVHVMGGAPGTRETDLLAPENTVVEIDALVLSGGSVYGLGAAEGVTAGLRNQGRGHPMSDALHVPIVPAAIIFDLMNGGDKDWDTSPYPALGRSALGSASEDFDLGTVGAGVGALTVNLKGGLGSASLVLGSGHAVGALAAVNPVGSVTVGDRAEFWAAPFEYGEEFGGLGPAPAAPTLARYPTKLHARQATAVAAVATDLALDAGGLKRLAIAAHDGIARAVVPSHTPFDGDLVFAVSTGARPMRDPVADPIEVGHAAAVCLSRAIARAVFEATPAPGDTRPTWHARFG